MLLAQDAHERVGARRGRIPRRQAGAARLHELFDALGGRRGILIEEPGRQRTQATAYRRELQAMPQALGQLTLQAHEQLARLARHAKAHERAELRERVDHLRLMVHVPVDASRIRTLNPQDLLAQVALAGNLLRRMHLQGQGLGGRDDFRQVRQRRAEGVEQAAAQRALWVRRDVLRERVPARQQRRAVRVGTEPYLRHGIVPGGGAQELRDRVRGAPRVSFCPADQFFHRSHPIATGHTKTRGTRPGPPPPRPLRAVRRWAGRWFRAPRVRRARRLGRAARRTCRSRRLGQRP